MTGEQFLRSALVSVEVSEDYGEAVLVLGDGSRLCFRHKVGERWAKSVGHEGSEHEPGLAGEVLASIGLFRLNAKHLDIQFTDGSRWEARFPGAGRK